MSGNSGASVAERPWLFKKGQSGNPSGRPKDAFDFAVAARKHTPEVLAMFLKSLRSNNWRERHSAGTVLLDRALGKPAMPIVGADGGSLTVMHLVAMREVGETIIAELALRQRVAVIDGRPVKGSAADEVPAAAGDLSIPARE